MDVTGVRSEQWSREVALEREGGRGSEEAEGIARDRDEDEGGGRRRIAQAERNATAVGVCDVPQRGQRSSSDRLNEADNVRSGKCHSQKKDTVNFSF